MMGYLSKAPIRFLLGTALGAVFATLLLAIPAVLGLLFVLYSLVFSLPISAHDVLGALGFGLLYISWGAAGGAAGGLVWNMIGGRLGGIVTGIVSMGTFFFFLLNMHETGNPDRWNSGDWIVWAILSAVFGLAMGRILEGPSSEEGA